MPRCRAQLRSYQVAPGSLSDWQVLWLTLSLLYITWTSTGVEEGHALGRYQIASVDAHHVVLPIPTLPDQELVDAGLALGLAMPQLSAARDACAALGWAARARALLQAAAPDRRPVSLPHPGSSLVASTPAQAGRDAAGPPDAAAEPSGADVAMPDAGRACAGTTPQPEGQLASPQAAGAAVFTKVSPQKPDQAHAVRNSNPAISPSCPFLETASYGLHPVV